LFVQAPIHGCGTGCFQYEWPQYVYPHNIFVELLSENGLVGFGLFAAILFVGVSSAYSALRGCLKRGLGSERGVAHQRTYVATALAMLALYLGNALTSFDIPGNSNIWFFVGTLYFLGLKLKHANVEAAVKTMSDWARGKRPQSVAQTPLSRSCVSGCAPLSKPVWQRS
jgi:O-antigen ligase